ncbi:MAG: cytochrome-c peroxidase [Flavobacteriales bacterium]|nr:cytochrome-c peroxidase [Flavobacteriales bacterium]
MKNAFRYYLIAAIVPLLASGCKDDEPANPSGGGGASTPTPYTLQIPANFPPMNVPANNPMTVEGVELGRFLFYDKRLSLDSSQSCASCHAQAFAFTDNGNAVSTGVDGSVGTRSSMALVNLGWGTSFFWDGRSPTLEDQVLHPVINPIEMKETWPHVVQKLQADPAYPTLFQRAFGSSVIDSVNCAKALAQFLRTMISGNSKYDKVQRGEASFTPDEAEGFFLFQAEGGPAGQVIYLPGGGQVVGQGGADCFHCHTNAAGLFTDEQFHNNGLDATFTDLGRGEVTGDPFDMGRFKTPTLRNVAVSGPFMHDGRFATLEEVIDHYDDGGQPSATVDPFMKFTDPDNTMGLTPQKKQQLLAFLNTLTDWDFLNDPDFQDPGPPQLPE